jgi:hypothetical protein
MSARKQRQQRQTHTHDQLATHMRAVAADLRLRAARWSFDGRETQANYARLFHSRYDCNLTGARLFFTRDVGHHSSGWLKNPDYERCWHLSISFFDPETGQPTRHLDRRLAGLWAQTFFGEHLPKVWVESAKSKQGQAMQVQHWRLFADEHWDPIIPRGEVYSTELTELGWRTSSQVWEEIC